MATSGDINLAIDNDRLGRISSEFVIAALDPAVGEQVVSLPCDPGELFVCFFGVSGSGALLECFIMLQWQSDVSSVLERLHVGTSSDVLSIRHR